MKNARKNEKNGVFVKENLDHFHKK